MPQSNAQATETILKMSVDYQDAMKAIGNYINELKQLKQEQDTINKAHKDGTITDRQYGEQLAKNRAVTTQLKGEMKALTDEVKKKLQADRAQIKQIDINNASYNKLAATYKQMKQRINEMSQAERQANKAYIDQSKQVYERMKTLQAETGKMQLNVGNYHAAITSAITGNSRFAASLLGLTTGATSASGALRMIGSAAKALGQSLMTLMANPVFVAIAGVAAVGMAFRWWKDYNDGLAEASRLTTQFTGQTGDQMHAIRDSIQATADTFGKDFKDVLQGADVLVAQYGISWQEAIDTINKGFISGADLNDDMLQQIEQYGPALRDAGLSAEELVAVIQQTRSGIFGKDGMDVIVKAGKNLRDMSSSTAEALRGVGINADEMKQKLADGSITMMQAIQQVSGALKDVSGNSQEAGAVISDVFGKKGVAAGQEQLKALQDLNMSLDSLIESEGEYGKAQQELLETQTELNEYTAALFGSDGWDVMKTKVETLVKKGLVWLLKVVIDIINYFIDWYNESRLVVAVVQLIVANVKNSWEVLKFVFSAIVDAVKGIAGEIKGLGLIIEGAFTFDLDKIKEGWAQVTGSITGAWSQIVVDAKNFGRNVAENYIDGFNAVVDHKKIGQITIPGLDDSATGSAGMSTGGGSSSTGGTSAKGGSSGSSTKAAAEEKAKEARQAAQKAALEELEVRRRIIEARLAIAKKGSEEELNLQMQQLQAEEEARRKKLEQEVMDEQSREELLFLMEQEFNKRRADLRTQFDEAERQRIEQESANVFAERLMKAADNELEMERIKLEQAQALRDNARQKEGETIEAFNARRLQLEQAYQEAKRDLTEKEVQVEQTKYEAVATITGAIGGLFEKLGEDNKDFANLSKILALAEIAINTGKAIAAGVAQAQSVPFPGNIAAIATTVATIMANIATAVSTVKAVKFAKGGLISGMGTGTSDSITARVSNGESVMTANATAMFTPLLSALNQLGGGVPIIGGGTGTQLGEDMLAAAIAKGYAMAPSPVVSVREITDVGNRVRVIERMAGA